MIMRMMITIIITIMIMMMIDVIDSSIMLILLLPSTVLSLGGQGIHFFKNAAAGGIRKVAVGYSPTPSSLSSYHRY